MACKNTPCKYNDSALPNGCKLFPGASWLNCRGASVKPVAADPKNKKNTNNKKENK